MNKLCKFSGAEKIDYVFKGIRSRLSIRQFCNSNNISRTSFYNWRNKIYERSYRIFESGRNNQNKKVTDSRKKAEAVKIQNIAITKEIRNLKSIHPLWGHRRIWSYLRYRLNNVINKKKGLSHNET